MTLDAARAAFPRLGLALYAYEPFGPVTLEVFTTEGQTFTFSGPSEAAVIARAFPSLTPTVTPTVEKPEPTTANVFD